MGEAMDDRGEQTGVQWLDQSVTLPVGVDWQTTGGRPGPRVPVTDDPDLHVLIAGLTPQHFAVAFEDNTCQIALPEDAGLVWLLSRSAIPREVTGWPDARRLGLPVARVDVDGWMLPLDDDAFREGWYEVESGYRWNNGRAALMLKPGARRLAITLHPNCPRNYPRDSVAADTGIVRRAGSHIVTPRTLAVVTMAFNEPDMLPLWLRHYTAQVGAAHCYVIDDGSDDGSTDAVAPANLIRLPRQASDDARRTAFVSEFCASLLRYYDHVAYADTDEIIVADPRHWRSLPEFCVATGHDVVTAIGLDVHHVARDEAPLDPSLPITAQRRWAQPLSAMCKPMMTRRPLRWTPGFHGADVAPAFDHLFNFHLGHCDRDVAFRRQAKRRATDDAVASSCRIDDARLAEMLQAWSDLPPVANVDLDSDCLDTRRFVRDVLARSRREGDLYHTDPGLCVPQLWRIPGRFVGVF